MITPMSYTKAVKVAQAGPKTEAQRHQAVKALRQMANHPDIGLDGAVRIRRQALRLLKEPLI